MAEASHRLLKEIRSYTVSGHPWRIVPDRVVISTNQVLNRDGSIRSGLRDPEDPGVAVYFTLDGKPYCLPCDKWDRIADNIAAIAAHLGAMRGMERWGVGSMERAFSGYAALPHRTGPSCWDVLGIQPAATEPEIMIAWRAKSGSCHPDKPGGSHEAMVQLNEAKDIALATVRARR